MGSAVIIRCSSLINPIFHWRLFTFTVARLTQLKKYKNKLFQKMQRENHIRSCTCHVPRPKVVAGMSSRNHLRNESSLFSALAAAESLYSRWKLPNLPENVQIQGEVWPEIAQTTEKRRNETWKYGICINKKTLHSNNFLQTNIQFYFSSYKNTLCVTLSAGSAATLLPTKLFVIFPI